MRPIGVSLFDLCGMCKFDISTVTLTTSLQWTCHRALTPTSILAHEHILCVGQTLCYNWIVHLFLKLCLPCAVK